MAHSLGSVYIRNIYNYNINNILRIIGDALFLIIMPIFFSMSGFLYRRPITVNDYLKLTIKKAINLLIPYIVFSIIYVCLQQLNSNVNNKYNFSSLLRIWYQPISYLWFLYTLFLIFVLIGFLSLFKISYLIQFIICLICFIFVERFYTNIFILSTFGFAMFFLLGVFIKENIKMIEKNKMVIFKVAFLLMLICFYFLYRFYGVRRDFNVVDFYTLVPKFISIFFSTSFCLILKKESKLFKYFSKYGKYSLIIYLVHAPCVSIMCALLFKIVTLNVIFSVMLIFLSGWISSLIVIYMNNKFSLIRFIFRPINTWKEFKSKY